MEPRTDMSELNDGRNVYIGGFSSTTTREQIEEVCSKSGRIQECSLILDSVTQQSRCFAFVSMSTVDEAKTLIRNLNGYIMDGKILTARLSKRGGSRPGGTLPPRYPTKGDPRFRDPYMRDPYLRDPYLRDPYLRDPYLRDPYLRDPYLRDPYLRDPYLRDPYLRDVRDPYVRDPYVRDPYVRDPYARDPYAREVEPYPPHLPYDSTQPRDIPEQPIKDGTQVEIPPQYESPYDQYLRPTSDVSLRPSLYNQPVPHHQPQLPPTTQQYYR